MTRLFWAVLCVFALANSASSITLQDARGRSQIFDPFARGKITVVVFVSARCPISNAFNFRLNTLYRQFGNLAQFLVIDSNANESLEEIQAHAKAMEYDFPVYRDVDANAAGRLGAASTPQAFVIDRRGAVIYRGYIEDAPNPARSKDPALRLAIEAALANRPAPVAETHGRGCAIIHKAPPVPLR